MLDALIKLDNGAALRASAEKIKQRKLSGGRGQGQGQGQSPMMMHSTNSTQPFSPTMSDIAGGTEAMRIIEGLRKSKSDVIYTIYLFIILFFLFLFYIKFLFYLLRLQCHQHSLLLDHRHDLEWHRRL